MSQSSPVAARSGGGGLRVTDESSAQGSGLECRPMEVEAGKKYEVTIWCRIVSGEGGLAVSLRFLDDAGKRLGKMPALVRVGNAPDWKLFTVSSVAPENAVAMSVRIESSPIGMATIDLDDFTCKMVEQPRIP